MQRMNELDDIINTTGTAFLGLTTGCARCHNHKFDPITQTDYYAMQAVFAGVKHGNGRISLTGKRKERLKALQGQGPRHIHPRDPYQPQLRRLHLVREQTRPTRRPLSPQGPWQVPNLAKLGCWLFQSHQRRPLLSRIQIQPPTHRESKSTTDRGRHGHAQTTPAMERLLRRRRPRPPGHRHHHPPRRQDQLFHHRRHDHPPGSD